MSDYGLFQNAYSIRLWERVSLIGTIFVVQPINQTLFQALLISLQIIISE